MWIQSKHVRWAWELEKIQAKFDHDAIKVQMKEENMQIRAKEKRIIRVEEGKRLPDNLEARVIQNVILG